MHMNRLLLAGIGFGIWLGATMLFRVAGHLFFFYENTAFIIGLWIVTAIALIGVAVGIFRWQKIAPEHRYQAAILLALPGMLGDAIAVQLFPMVFPNMNVDADGAFAAWLLWAYASVLFTGLWQGGTSQSE